jgi:hypothetical protein
MAMHRTPETLARLKAEFLKDAEAAFEQLFDEDKQEQLITFDRREERVLALSRKLGTRMLAGHLGTDPRTTTQAACCPKCQRPGQPDGATEVRALRTQAGDVSFGRGAYRCRRCRIRFFPSRP